MQRLRASASHAALAFAEASLIALLVVGLVAGSALAAPNNSGRGSKGGGNGTSTVALVLVNDQNANGAPNYADTVTFTASTTATDKPMVGLRCYQGSTFVFDAYVALFDSWLSKNLTLASSYWDPAADASCTARLFYYDNRSREQILTTLQFAVAP